MTQPRLSCEFCGTLVQGAEFLETSREGWRCVDCGVILCWDHVDKKFSTAKFIGKSIFTAATAGLGGVVFSTGKGVSKDCKCLACGSENIRKL